MTEKRYYEKDYDELYYIFDSKILSEKEFEEKVEYDGYSVFADSLTSKEVLDLLNENEKLKRKRDYYKKLRIHLNGLIGEDVDVTELNYQLEKENEALKKEQYQAPFLKIFDDYFIYYKDETFSMHKPKDIRCLCFLLNKEHGFTELQCEYNDEEMI